jgi:PKD repeat protein
MKAKILSLIIFVLGSIDSIGQNPPLAQFSTMTGITTYPKYPNPGCLCEFIDLSQNNPTFRNWVITPSSYYFYNNTNANSQNPEVVFLAPGNYSVTLTVSNQYGSDSEIKLNYISVIIIPVSTQDYSIYTPNCTQVDECYDVQEYWTIQDIIAFTAYAENDVGLTSSAPASHEYNCHAWAWYLYDDENADKVWMETPGDDTYKNNYSNSDGSYILTSIEDPEATKVAYSDNGDHSAIIISNSGSLILESKWGAWPRFVHEWNNCPIEYFSGGTININQLSFYKPAPIQGADFTVSNTTINVGESLDFQNLSPAAFYSFNWSFQGGTPISSQLPNPVITYNSPGVYNVTLVAANGNCSKTETKTQYIHVEDVLSASFTATPNPVIRGHYVIFSNTSTGNATSWDWTFQGGFPEVFSSENPPGDGIFYSSNLAPGIYPATLTISNPTGSDSRTVNIYVQADNSPLFAGFSSNYQTIPVGSTIDFFDESLGEPNTWQWDIGIDGTIDSYKQNPTNILFDEEGNYDVKLTVTKGAVTDDETKTGYITVVENTGGDLFADFIAPNGTSVVVNTPVQFYDLTFGNPTFRYWTFEDATPSESWDQNPIVQFNEWGMQDVTLYVSNGFDEDEIIKENYINVFENGILADFSIEPTTTFHCYNLLEILQGFTNPEISWFVYDPYGFPISTSGSSFCTVSEGYHTIIMDVYNNGYYYASVTKYLEVCNSNHCTNGYQDCDETAIDCGGMDCGSCGSSPNCNDCIKNGYETGVDCGGSCEPCQYSCTDVTKYYANTNPPSLTHASDAIIAGDGWVIVPPNGDVIFRAGNSITLKTGFKAEEGSQFLAQTTPCYCQDICWDAYSICFPLNCNNNEYPHGFMMSTKGVHKFYIKIKGENNGYIYENEGFIYEDGWNLLWDGIDAVNDEYWFLPDSRLESTCDGSIIDLVGYSFILLSCPDDDKKDVYQDAINNSVIDFKDQELLVYPNPNKGKFVVSIEQNKDRINLAIYNSLGEGIFFKHDENENDYFIDLSAFPDGIYTLKVKIENQIFIEKIIKQ